MTETSINSHRFDKIIPILHYTSCRGRLLGPAPNMSFNFTLNEKLSAHSLQFVSKYHVFLISLRAQIRDHTHRNFGEVAIYHTAVELE